MISFKKTLFCTLALSMNLGLNAVPVAQGSIYEEILLLSTKNWSLLGFQCIFKLVKTKRKIFRQSWTKYLWPFSLFSTISLHDKWNGTRLLSQESECTSCLTSYWTNLRKLGSFKKISKMYGFNGEYPAVHPKIKFLCFLLKHCKKSAVKHSIEKPNLLNFVNLSPAFCPRLQPFAWFFQNRRS